MPPRPALPRALILTLMAGALVLVLIFAVRLGLGLAGWSVRPQDPVAGWMPLGYIARAWDVPAPDLGAALGLDVGAARGQSLERIARDQGLALPEVIARIEAAIATARAGADD